MGTDIYWKFITLCALTYSRTLCLDQDQQRVLVVSFDGFRWDYVTRFPTPNFKRFIESGAHVKQVTNIFATKTYPNHYTLVTGLYAENHGVVANEMFDPVLNETFSMTHMDIYKPEFWEDAVPIWVTNQLEGHRSGAAMWPGTDVRIHSVFPSQYLPYNETVPFEFRVGKLIEWFNGDLINLGLLYWEEPDEMGHFLGPDNPLMENTIADVDAKLGYLVDQLKKAKLWDSLNVIVTSDHGMSQCSLDKIIELDKYIDRGLYTMIDHSPVVAILPKEGKLDEVYQALVNIHPNMTVYKKEEIPLRFHYKQNVRIQPIIIVADVGWYILQNRSSTFLWGDHGYDNLLPDMHPLLIASGPAFKKNFTRDAMNSTDLYPLLCHLLDITPLPNNGSLGNVMDLLASSPLPNPKDDEKQESYANFIGVFLGGVIVIVFLFVFLKHLTPGQIPKVHKRHIEIAQPLLQS
ncbi:ectonucleotide pyrophosphatase/phosphodiesterase family member 5 [Ascaphus truei]|uniref:ectonucleotide pyrophosphatase/phosphodiesterase family member 5 n=1 Tax=Ascaphus truei TaxID=8439 RepID=UPI003F5932FD